MLTKKTINEYQFATKTLHYTNKIDIIKMIYIYYYQSTAIWDKIKKYKFDVDNTIFYSYWLNAQAFTLANMVKNGKCKIAISRAHAYDCFYERGYQPFRREIIHKLKEIHPISDTGKLSIERHYLNHVPMPHSAIITSRLGVFVENVGNNSQDKVRNRHKIVSCSYIDDIKRLDILINAISEIDDLNIEWVHFGNGPLEASIKQLAYDKLYSKENVSYFFLGQIDNREILNYYRQNHIDIFVNCSDVEGIPVSVMEAFANRIPAIARNVGGCGELVNNNNGLLLREEASVAGLKSAIQELLSLKPEEWEQKSQKAYETFNSMYNLKKNCNSFYDHIASL